MISGCDDMLDLEPKDTITEDRVFEKFGTADAAVAGTYHILFSAATEDYVLTEGTSPTCEYSVAAKRLYDPINNGAILPEDENLQKIYSTYYAALCQANLLMYKIPELGQYEEALKSIHLAEAKYIRAYALHRLLAWYGDGALMDKMQNDGVVLYLEHYDGFDRDKDIHPRSTNEKVFDQIVKDLEEAITDLEDPSDITDVETRVSRANKATCEALLARVYLYKREYANAATYAQKVLDRTQYNLETDLLKVFPPNPNGTEIAFSSEHIFGFPVSSNGGNWQFGGNSIYYNYNNFWYSTELINTFSANDERRLNLINETQKDGKTVYVTNKYPNSNGRDNMTMIRLPEIILSKAEALARISNNVTPEMVGLLNDIHLRANPTEAGYQISDFASNEEFIDRVLLERSKELTFEGFSRFDQLRTDRPLYNSELPNNKKVFPIPLREIQITNGVVKQNEGYLTN